MSIKVCNRGSEMKIDLAILSPSKINKPPFRLFCPSKVFQEYINILR